MTWQEDPRGSTPPPELWSLSGLEVAKALISGKGPYPPVCRLFGIKMTSSGPGTITFTMDASPWLASHRGSIDLGALAALTDFPASNALLTLLGPSVGFPTIQLTMSSFVPVEPGSGLIRAVGTVVSADETIGLSQTMVHDGAGRLVAHATSHCRFIPPAEPPPPAAELPPLPAETYDTPDPCGRPAPPLPVVDRTMAGLDFVRGLVSGEVAPAPLNQLTGLRATDAGEGFATFALPCSAWLGTAMKTVLGGATAMLADAAVNAAVMTTCSAWTDPRPLDLRVSFLRPAMPDGRELTATARVANRTRTMALAECQVVDASGGVVAIAHGSTLTQQPT